VIKPDNIKEEPVQIQLKQAPVKGFVEAKPVQNKVVSKNFFERFILNRSMKSMEEDKKKLENLARTKRKRDS
jgi:hypothetical protein